MTWNDTTRPQYERKSDRYASDLTDDEWRLCRTEIKKGAGQDGRLDHRDYKAIRQGRRFRKAAAPLGG